MIDNNDKKNNVNEVDDFFAKFDKISDDYKANSGTSETSAKNDYNKQDEKPSQLSRKTRSSRHAEKKQNNAENILTTWMNKISDFIKSKFFRQEIENEDEIQDMTNPNNKKRRKKKKYKLNVKKIIRLVIILCIIIAIAVALFAANIVRKAPKIDPDNIYSLLAESSVLYDNQENIIATVGNSSATRTIIEFSDLPDNLINAFVAIEDKTFWEHKGFNFIRIFGAIKDSIFSGNKIGGTSTITQQLARNVYLADSKSVRSIERKIAEAYYAIQIEKTLSKEQIIEAYLNTIDLGFGAQGVQAASQAYFSKDVNELDLLECAALASLPKAPSTFALIKKLDPDDVDADTSIIIYQGSDYTYVYNGDVSENRRNQTLYNMHEQGKITDEEYEAAKNDSLVNHINPNMSSITEISSYFADYVIEQVILDLANENKIDYADAKKMAYSGGLQIYTTMDSKIQKIMEQEYANNDNFPKVAGLKKDSSGNIVSSTGKILLYAMSSYFDENDYFRLQPDEYEWLPDGSMKLLKGKRLNFYKTIVGGQEDISIEFKNMYYIDDNNVFYSIGGGVILIPQNYKQRDEDGNAIISSDFFTEDQKYFQSEDGVNLYVDSGHYSLKQPVIQPQSAMVITDYTNGHIKAMVGGRNTVGKLLFNRATSTRQPGSSMKPITVYGAALQKSLDTLNAGSTPVFETFDNNGNPVANMYGTFMTAASVIDDAPLIVDGTQWPKNWYTGFRGLYTFRTSVEQSVNVCAVKVFEQVGPEYALNFAKKLGITSFVEEGESNDMNPAAMALGGMTKGASPLEMASAYGTFANQGTYISPIGYTRVTNKRGEVILDNVPRTEEVVDKGVSFIMTDILHTTVTKGIAGRAAIGTQPVAGKTGTTSDNYDAWFVGFTPQYTAAVWIGNDINIELSEGSASAARLWSKVMKRALEGVPTGTFAQAPENVVSETIDTKSGLLPTEISSYDDRGTVVSEYFIKGTEPTDFDNIHTYVNVCAETGYLATPYCMHTQYKFGVKRPYLVSEEVADLPYEVPHYYCNLHNPNVNIYPIWGSEIDPTQPDNPNGAVPGLDPNAGYSPDTPPAWLDPNTNPNDSGGINTNGNSTDTSDNSNSSNTSIDTPQVPNTNTSDGTNNNTGDINSGDTTNNNSNSPTEEVPTWLLP